MTFIFTIQARSLEDDVPRDRSLCTWYKSSKPDLVIFNAGVILLMLEAPDVYQINERWGLRFVVLITLMDLCQRALWHGNCDADSSRKGKSVVFIDQC